MIINYIDYNSFFILFCVIFFGVIFNKSTLYYKYNFISTGKANVFILSSFICIFYNFVTIINLNFYIQNYNFNIVCIYKIFLFIFSLLFFVMFKEYINLLKLFSYESVWILLYSLVCLNLLINCNNYLYFFLILESYSFSILSSLALLKLSKKFISSSFSYLIFNIIISCLMLYSISIIYFCTGVLSFSELNDLLNNFILISNDKILFVSVITLIFCFFIKFSLFPFSLYLLQLYSNMSFIFIFFFLTIPKFCFSLFFFNNFYFFVNNNYFIFNNFLIIFIVLNSFIHSLFCTKDTNVKNFIINTSFSNTPFLLCFVFFKNIFLLNSFFNFIIIYVINFFVFFFLVFLCCSEKNIIHKKFFNFYGLLNNNLKFFVITIFFFISLCSLPPFSGFFAKFYILYFFVCYKMYIFYFLFSVFNLFLIYGYLKIMKIMFSKTRNYSIKIWNDVNKYVLYLLSFLLLFNLFFCFLFDFSYKVCFIVQNINILI